MNNQELEELLSVAKAELDDEDEETGMLKIELNDTNRPDLWSTAGLGRQLRIYESGTVPHYDFFSTRENRQEVGERIVEVDAALQAIRPFVAAFAVRGIPISDPMLKDIIQTQEKLCWNFGQKRKSIAMGVYRSDILTYPVKYVAANPDTTQFVPLQMERSLSLREILTEHPKGQEFGWIVDKMPVFPFLTDAKDEVLSFPPIINSNRLGTVEVGDQNLFIEMTGTEIHSLLLAVSIVACDLADAGYQILPVKTVYPYDTLLGREVVAPFYFQKTLSVGVDAVNRLLGEKFNVEQAASYALRMGLRNSVEDNTISITVPAYRNDFLHSVDIIEDIMIGRGTNEFEPVMPSDFTPGRLSTEEIFAREVRNIMLGFGYQEMIFNYLGSKKNYIDRMGISADALVQIQNPMTENYEFLRNSNIPALLETESVSGHAVYPHNTFEVGKVAYKDAEDNQGSVTRNWLAFLTSDGQAGYNDISSVVSGIFYYLNRDYEIIESKDSRFIKGRCADIIYRGAHAGSFGEIHPQVLENWGIEVPCTACELDLDTLLT